MHFQTIALLLPGLTLIYLIASLIYDRFLSPTRSIPGPIATRLSRLWFFQKVRSGSFHHTNIALHKKYGPIVRIAPNWYSISNPDKTIYGIGSKFPKNDWYQGWKHPSKHRWTMFPDQDIKRHTETRKRFQGLYSMTSLLSYEGYVDECIDVFVDKLKGFAAEGRTIDLAHWFQCYAFDALGKITYSERFGFLDNGDDIAGTIEALDRSMPYSTLVGIYSWVHPYLYAIMEKIPGSGPAGRTYLMEFVQRKIQERNESKEKGEYESRKEVEQSDDTPQDFLDKMIMAQKEKPDKVTPYHIFMMGLSNIIAGSDTTAVSLSSVAYNLIRTPQVLKKLRQEITEHGLDDRRITFKDSQDMPYLQAVIKEALRLHPATGLPLWRVVPEGGVQLGDHWLPPGASVGVNSWVAHYDTDIFGADADVFRPERWEEAKQESEELFKKMEMNYMPFGLGTRTCIGRHISMLEMCKLVPEIVKNFDMHLGMPAESWTTINYWFVKPERFPVTFSRRVASYTV